MFPGTDAIFLRPGMAPIADFWRFEGKNPRMKFRQIQTWDLAWFAGQGSYDVVGIFQGIGIWDLLLQYIRRKDFLPQGSHTQSKVQHRCLNITNRGRSV